MSMILAMVDVAPEGKPEPQTWMVYTGHKTVALNGTVIGAIHDAATLHLLQRTLRSILKAAEGLGHACLCAQKHAGYECQPHMQLPPCTCGRDRILERLREVAG